MATAEEIPTGRERLAQWIERSKLTQGEAAAIIDMDPTQLSQILTGKRRPGLDNAIKIHRTTGIVPDAWASTDDDSVSSGTTASVRKARSGKS
jgi:transcriptional regulator with XRE-family HTH domain